MYFKFFKFKKDCLSINTMSSELGILRMFDFLKNNILLFLKSRIIQQKEIISQLV